MATHLILLITLGHLTVSVVFDLKVSVSLPAVQQLTMQSVAPSIYEFYSGRSHLYPTATPAPTPQITASITRGMLYSWSALSFDLHQVIS